MNPMILSSIFEYHEPTPMSWPDASTWIAFWLSVAVVAVCFTVIVIKGMSKK